MIIGADNTTNIISAVTAAIIFIGLFGGALWLVWKRGMEPLHASLVGIVAAVLALVVWLQAITADVPAEAVTGIGGVALGAFIARLPVSERN